ncbi:preprotein translocase subunit SecG [Nitriliruptoraceae bacterium ZYF776]|nr:preprotein translocase subunit SecG [Profundirhabdus halotolerans]
MTWIIFVIHAILCLILIGFVLLHRGSGGGLSDMFGGGSGGGLQGSAVVERNLDRLTVITALLFAATNIALVTLI